MWYLGARIAAVAIVLGANSALAQFGNATTGDLVGRTGTPAWIDTDNDADVDLFLASDQGLNGWLRNDVGTFVAQPPQTWPNGEQQYWGDYDGDGDLDLYITAGFYFQDLLQNTFWRNDGSAFSQIPPPQTMEAGAGQPREISWWDYDQDGDVDAYVGWVTTSGPSPSRLFRNDGNGTFTDVATGPLTMGGTATWADYDNDGDLDLYLVSAGASGCRLLRNDGAGAFVDVTTPTLNGPPSNSANGWANAAAWGDYDNDGDLDVCLAYNHDNGIVHLYRNEANGTFVEVTGTLPTVLNCWTVAWVDYDNDGDLDLCVGSGTGDRLLRNDGAAGFATTSIPLLSRYSSSRALAWGDYDNDGDLDVWVPDYNTQDFTYNGSLLRNDATGGNHWLQIDVRGTVSNRFAVGARVQVVTSTSSQIRELEPQRADSRILQFGLGSATTADVIVTWPSKRMRLLHQVAANQRLQITEPSATDVTQSLPVTRLTLHRNVPNPFNPRTTVTFDVAQPGEVSLVLYDAAGRRVRVLSQGWLPAGRFERMWDGTDDKRVRVPSGVYICTLGSGAERVSQRMTLMK